KHDAPASALHHPSRGKLREKVGTFEIHTQQLVEAAFRSFENVAPLALRDTGVVHQNIEALPAPARMLNQSLAISRNRNIAREDFGAGLGLQGFGCVAPAAIRADHLVGL